MRRRENSFTSTSKPGWEAAETTPRWPPEAWAAGFFFSRSLISLPPIYNSTQAANSLKFLASGSQTTRAKAPMNTPGSVPAATAMVRGQTMRFSLM